MQAQARAEMFPCGDVLIVRAAPSDVGLILEYWRDLEKSGHLKYRFSDFPGITPELVVQHFVPNPDYLMFNVYDPVENAYVADFALENFTGKAAQIHFSFKAAYPMRRKLEIARRVTDTILEEWEIKPGEAYLETLFGLTPVKHKVACRFVTQVGFKRVGVLPKCIRYFNEIDNALLTVKERKQNGR